MHSTAQCRPTRNSRRSTEMLVFQSQSWESDVWIRTAPKPLSLQAGTCTMLWRTAHPRRPGEWQGEGRQDSTGGSPSRQMAMRITVGCRPLFWGQQRYPAFVRGPWGLTAGLLSSPRAVLAQQAQTPSTKGEDK